jgi:hypothetical protein
MRGKDIDRRQQREQRRAETQESLLLRFLCFLLFFFLHLFPSPFFLLPLVKEPLDA